ncbi:MAG: OmpA family protein [Bacteroidota bacterium]
MKIASTLFSLTLLYAVHAQEQLIRKSADQAFEQFTYSKALEKYLYLHKKDSGNVHYVSRIGETYLKLNDSQNAEQWLSKLINEYDGFDNQLLFEYAQALSKNKKYEEAKHWYDRYESAGGSSSTERKVEGIGKLQTFFSEAGKYTIKRLDFNTVESDFSPFFYENGIAFVSSRKEKEWVKSTYNWDESEYLDFYYFNPLDTGRYLSKIKGLNSTYHEGPAQVYSDGNKIVFTRNSVEGSKLQRDKKGKANLQLFFAEKEESGKWGIAPFQHNTLDYSLGHPTISAAGDFLIFASDMPGGFGGTDLYVSKADASENWSEPVNLGSAINTSENEMFPFLSGNDLWFSSNGREGLGGLDIYRAQLTSDQVVGQPANVGAPINSSQDDFGLITEGDYKKGYFTSDREGSDDLFQYTTDLINVKGRVLTKGLNTPVDDAQVTLKDKSGKVIGKVVTDEQGYYTIELGKGTAFTLTAAKKDFLLEQPVEETTRNVADFKELKTLYLLQRLLFAEAIDASSEDTLTDATYVVHILEKENELVTPINDEGNEFKIKPATYEVITIDEGYYTLRDTLTIDEGFFGIKNYTARLKKIVVGESIRLDHIYYDVNSAHLRHESELELDKVVVFMMDNSHIKIELSSHTDARGSASYNRKLSQRRAESATEFLINHGIAAERIVPKGYGESKLVNRCSDGTTCSSDEHQENRRTEIKILGNE